ncbi:MAG: alpha/beta hydrolase family protein [Candidatus Cyclobacteriaceae bacterium M3_2C_046]
MRSMILYRSCFYFLIILLTGSVAIGQTKKPLSHEVYDSWKTIENATIAADGEAALYVLQPQYGDSELVIQKLPDQQTFHINRGTEPTITYAGDYAVFRIKPPLDTLKSMRRRKVKKESLPMDSLGLWQFSDDKLVKFPRIKTFKTPEEADGWLAFTYRPGETKVQAESDSSTGKKIKRASDLYGYPLILRKLNPVQQDTFPHVLDYHFALQGRSLIFSSTGNDSLFKPGVYVYDLVRERLQPLKTGKGQYKQLALSEDGLQAAFLASTDTTEEASYGLYHWQMDMDAAEMLADSSSALLNAEKWILNPHHPVKFARDGSKLYFHAYPPPVQPDTSLLEEEKISVEVWSWKDTYLQTQQQVEKEKDLKQGYQLVYRLDQSQILKISDPEVPQVELGDEGNASVALTYTNLPYGQLISWEGFSPYHDVYLNDLESGQRQLVAQKLKGTPHLSPRAKYIYWYAEADSSWFTYHIASGETFNLTQASPLFHDELHDYPDFPRSYGLAGWTENDEYFLIYDRYDIWKFDPRMEMKPEKLTQGRDQKVSYRYMKLDPKLRHIPTDRQLYLKGFDEKTKTDAFYQLGWTGKNQQPEKLYEGNYLLTPPIKARSGQEILFTRQNFREFPDLWYSTLTFNDLVRISQANPQQDQYLWGDTELVEWISLDGIPLQGILVKPDNFDPGKKYPLLVNFYERSSDGLHRHRAPEPHRSTINYAFYASRGYLIFNPDVPYKPGYPGESCFNAVMPGVTYLINQGFVDEKNIGLQGHSWGGYQISYLVTKTNLFKAAEAGAPVPNMISAYGGIRWETGLSRMFQYEHSQSRIGGTLWEYPLRYLENSPIFFLDKVTTPMLIMHNDKDGHVPWYQGIELFVALRRLGKPAWMLNYNEEPHWPLKYQHKKDFAQRLQQYFDHYLKGSPAPAWMQQGIPAVEKGINLGYETTSPSSAQ